MYSAKLSGEAIFTFPIYFIFFRLLILISVQIYTTLTTNFKFYVIIYFRTNDLI
jgi:hypothetical protein